jgi:hypothetical protein
MEPSFQNAEYILTDKVSYRLHEPRRGDVVVFHSPQEEHLPSHLGLSFPQELQTKTDLTLAIPMRTFLVLPCPDSRGTTSAGI